MHDSPHGLGGWGMRQRVSEIRGQPFRVRIACVMHQGKEQRRVEVCLVHRRF